MTLRASQTQTVLGVAPVACLAALAASTVAGCGWFKQSPPESDTGVPGSIIVSSMSNTDDDGGIRRSTDASPEARKAQRQKQMIEVRREMAYEQYEYGLQQLNAQRYDRAAEFFTDAIMADPEDPVYWNMLGRTQYWKQNYPEARKALAQAEHIARRLAPGDVASGQRARLIRAQIACNLADIDRAESRSAEALRGYTQAVELDPRLARAQFELGDLYLRNHNYESAESRFRATLELDPGEMRARLGLVMCYHAIGNDEMAWREVQTIEADGEFSVESELRSSILAGRDRQRADVRRRALNMP